MENSSNFELANILVTIYIPTYNRVDLLKRAVSSVQSQTYSNIEIIVVDDCSTDETESYLKSIVEQDQRIRYFIKDKNSGACVSRNIAIAEARGNYITGLDDDDYFLPTRIENFVKNIHLLDKYTFIFTENYLGYEDCIKAPPFDRLKPKTVIAADLLYSNVVGNQCFISVDKMRKYGKFSENLQAWQDMDVWYRLLKTDPLHQARRVAEKTYVQDVSHEYGRITTQNRLNKIVNVFHDFSEKNSLSESDKNCLKGHLVSYGVKLDSLYLIKRLMQKKQAYFFIKNIYLFLKNFKNKYKLG